MPGVKMLATTGVKWMGLGNIGPKLFHNVPPSEAENWWDHRLKPAVASLSALGLLNSSHAYIYGYVREPPLFHEPE